MAKFLGYLTLATAITLVMAVAARAGKLTLASPSVIDGGIVPNAHVFNGYGYQGENRSPQLAWTDPPAGTKSYAVTMHDPDAPHPGGWWHWVVFDIPAGTEGLPEDAGSGKGLPNGAVQSMTDFQTTGYGGPSTPPSRVDEAIRRNALGEVSITAKFGK